MWFSIVNCTGNIGHDLEKMNNRDKAMFILNAMNIGFIQEWYYIYDCIHMISRIAVICYLFATYSLLFSFLAVTSYK